MVTWHRSSRTRRARRAGFTLLEVLFATSVLFVTMLAAVSSQIASIGLMRTARDNHLAISELSAAMEEILATPIDAIPTATRYPEGQSIATYDARRLRDERIVPDYPNHAGGAVPNALHVVLEINYTNWAGRAGRMRLASIKAR